MNTVFIIIFSVLFLGLLICIWGMIDSTYLEYIYCKLRSWTSNKKMLKLTGYEGKVWWSLDQGNWCYVYTITQVGYVRLEQNGEVNASYIKKWDYV